MLGDQGFAAAEQAAPRLATGTAPGWCRRAGRKSQATFWRKIRPGGDKAPAGHRTAPIQQGRAQQQGRDAAAAMSGARPGPYQHRSPALLRNGQPRPGRAGRTATADRARILGLATRHLRPLAGDVAPPGRANEDTNVVLVVRLELETVRFGDDQGDFQDVDQNQAQAVAKTNRTSASEFS